MLAYNPQNVQKFHRHICFHSSLPVLKTPYVVKTSETTDI